MRGGIIAAAIVALVLVGSLMGIISIFFIPLAAAVALVVLIVWLLRRRAEGKPPIR